MRISDWSSDVCSSDLQALARLQPGGIVVASAANDAGAKSHEADLARIAGPLVSRSKHKCRVFWTRPGADGGDAALRSEEHTSELQSLMRSSYAVFCLKKKNMYKRRHQMQAQHTKDKHTHKQNTD